MSPAAARIGIRCGQVLDVAQLVDRLAHERLAERRPGDDLGKRLEQEQPSADRARRGRRVRQRLGQEPAQPRQFPKSQHEEEPAGPTEQARAHRHGRAGRGRPS